MTSPSCLERLVEWLEGQTFAAGPDWFFPPATVEMIRRSKGLSSGGGRAAREWRELRGRLDHLDRASSGWPEAAVELVAHGDPQSAAARRAALLLSARPVMSVQPLVRALDPPVTDLPRARLALLALLSTDAPSTRSLWEPAFDELALRPGPEPALWLCLAKLLREGRLDEERFRAGVEAGVLDCLPADPAPGGYHRALDQARLGGDMDFILMYRRLVDQTMAEGRGREEWPRISWARHFAGPQYFYESLDAIEQYPACPHELFVLRWACEFGEREPDFARRLGGYGSLTLLLLSFLRPDLADRIAETLDWPQLEACLRWMRQPAARAWRDPARAGDLPQWAVTHGTLMGEALGALCSLDCPAGAAPPGEEHEPPRVREFIETYLLPPFSSMLDNLFCVQAVRGLRAEVFASAQRGRVPAIRALGLLEGDPEDTARALDEIRRRGSRWEAEAAREGLQVLAERHGLPSAEALQRKLRLALAWADGGLGSRQARVWWEVGGHRVKLQVGRGKVEVVAYGPRGPRSRLPEAVRKAEAFGEVKAVRAELTAAYRRLREHLEEAMAGRQALPVADVRALLGNPVFANLASRLVLRLSNGHELLGPEGEAGPLTGALARLGEADSVWVAHPQELAGDGSLGRWQDSIVASRMVQPFKQCFREFYLADSREMAETRSPRFAGLPVHARRAFALLRQRRYHPGRGDAARERPAVNLRAHIVWATESDDLGRRLTGSRQDVPVTTGEIYFERLSPRRTEVGLSEVDPVIFSETLRDADLVVSLAAAGEMGLPSRQTLAIRASLVRRLARARGLWHVCVAADDVHVIIQGRRASYRVHLGSGSVLIEESGRHLDLRGLESPSKSYLPSEEADSRTADILRVVSLLSEDHKIESPLFLSQVAGGE